MNVLIYEKPHTAWANQFVQSLQRASDDENSPYHIIETDKLPAVDFVVIDLNSRSIADAQMTLHKLRADFPRSGIVSICEDDQIEATAHELGVYNAYSGMIMHTLIWPRFSHRFLQAAEVATRDYLKTNGHQS